MGITKVYIVLCDWIDDINSVQGTDFIGVYEKPEDVKKAIFDSADEDVGRSKSYGYTPRLTDEHDGWLLKVEDDEGERVYKSIEEEVK